jgi:transposase
MTDAGAVSAGLMSIPMDMPMAIEVITGAGPRRRFSVEEKLQLIEETQQPGMSVSLVARRHGISRDLLFRWRRDWRRGLLSAPGLVPVQVAGAAAAKTSERRSAVEHGVIEIGLPSGWCVRVTGAVEAEALRRVLTVVAGRPVCRSLGEGR